ncbi:hypothetical protein O181_133338 [Austropuccinia psidii MF-1]|uniref:Uncharacterized protein n=1 Tax=Austropuccinia psidii MF-1 TaxID=1389203 RepID=A0A9Q3L440_9BASI|nr:hypothetical protein [Austropuccinia psidii MF-1]
MLSKADVWNPVQQKTKSMPWKISLLEQELVKPGLESLCNPKWSQKTSREDKRPERPVLKCHNCGSTSHLAKPSTNKTNINEFKFIEEVQCTEEEEESDLDSSVSEDTPVEDHPIENITHFFEVTRVHTHLL